ncbi:PilN domain-containing protein [Candidatus Woesebacteria bacterium]|nr:PilN domain-containing protein [Candidatus Woesebacteria bacterium]
MKINRSSLPSFGLLPQKEFIESTFGRVLTWTLSSFRIIVIITELVVVIAFLSRFWLDAKITDLNDEVKQKQAIIASFSSIETKFRLTQQKLKIFSTLSANEKQVSNILSAVTSNLPPDIILTSFSISEKKARIEGQSFTEQSIFQFITNIENANLFEKVSLGEASLGKDKDFISFSINGQVKEGEKEDGT